MFVWLKLKGITDSSSLIKTKAVEKKVLLVPGFEVKVEMEKRGNMRLKNLTKKKSDPIYVSQFFPNSSITDPNSYCRASYSTASPEEIDLALKRLGELVRECKSQQSQ